MVQGARPDTRSGNPFVRRGLSRSVSGGPALPQKIFSRSPSDPLKIFLHVPKAIMMRVDHDRSLHTIAHRRVLTILITHRQFRDDFSRLRAIDVMRTVRNTQDSSPITNSN